jgi:hypothetical protein
MAAKLPPWVVSNRESVLAEAAPYRHLSADERARHLAIACRTSGRMLRARPDWQRIVELRDPLPESSRAALVRLRAEAQHRRAVERER